MMNSRLCFGLRLPTEGQAGSGTCIQSVESKAFIRLMRFFPPPRFPSLPYGCVFPKRFGYLMLRGCSAVESVSPELPQFSWQCWERGEHRECSSTLLLLYHHPVGNLSGPLLRMTVLSSPVVRECFVIPKYVTGQPLI